MSYCIACGEEVQIQIFKGLDHCSENHRKKLEADDEEWCSIYGYAKPSDHFCTGGVCYNPTRDGKILKGTLQDRIDYASDMIHWNRQN